MNVSKEVKDLLADRYCIIRKKADELDMMIAFLRDDIKNFTVTEPAPAAPKHEWRVGDCFRVVGDPFNGDTRKIVKTSVGVEAIDPSGYSQLSGFDKVEKLIAAYGDVVFVTESEWFAAVRKAMEGK